MSDATDVPQPAAPKTPPPTVTLDERVLDGFDQIAVGKPVRIELTGRVKAKRESAADPKEDWNRSHIEIEVSGARVLGRPSDAEAEKMSSDELDEATEQEFNARTAGQRRGQRD